MEKVKPKALKISCALVLLLCFFISMLSVVFFSGCDDRTDDKIHIITTIFPQYDWIKNIVGENADKFDISYLVDNGVDIHNYGSQMSVDDRIKILNCDMFVYIGGESESWVDDVLSGAKNKDMIRLRLFDTVESDLLTIDHDEDHHNENAHEEYDEHIFLSIKLSIKMVDEIAKKICLLDSENETTYKNNASAYIEKLSDLDEQYSAIVKHKDMVVFADRFPFRYLLHDYNIPFTAAFDGCTTDTNASFETIVKLANAIDEFGLNVVLKIEGSNNEIANAVINLSKAKNQKILSLNSMQSVNIKTSNITYLSAMAENLNVLQQALN